MKAILGCIADDFTGATDMAGTLTRAGMRTVQMIGVQAPAAFSEDVDAIVIALKSRTIPADQAIRQSIDALKWLQAAGCRQFVFKYCSTFDSTDAGNIGQVTEALLEALEADFTIACPAFPRNGRLVFKGYLFVGDGLLNESGMEHHPLTPMTDANLVRVLQRQVQGSVGLVDYREIRQGPDAVRAAFDTLRSKGKRIAIVDTLDEDDLGTLASAASDLSLITGGSGIGSGLADNYRRQGLLKTENGTGIPLPVTKGTAAVIAGSCSRATQVQIEWACKQYPAFKIDPVALSDGRLSVADIVGWAAKHLEDGPVVIYSTVDPEALARVQERLGKDQAGTMIEGALSAVAVSLVEHGVRRLIVAGGETSGAIVKALGIRGLRICQEIAPGVPWTQSIDEPMIALALKSGNFGDEDFFVKALEMT